jgi:hypothetical protein
MSRITTKTLIKSILKISDNSIKHKQEELLRIDTMIKDLNRNTIEQDEMIKKEEFSGETQEGKSSNKKPHGLKARVGHKGGTHYEYVKDLPENYETITKYNDWKFNNLFYKDGVFYAKAGDSFRKLMVLGSDKNCHVNLFDVNGVFGAISINKFNRLRTNDNAKDNTKDNTKDITKDDTKESNENTINEDS